MGSPFTVSQSELDDLKHQLYKSIEREQEIERELQECEDSYMQLASLQSRHYEERNHYREQLFYAENNLSEERARADALARTIMDVKCDCHMEPLEHGTHMAGCNMPKVNELLEAHRQAREEGPRNE